MKITCEYCDSYVEVDENMKCPLCGGPLGTAIEAERDRQAQETEAAAQREAEAQAAEAKESHISEIIAGVTSVATAFVAAKTAADANDDEPERPIAPAERPPHAHEQPPVHHGMPNPHEGPGNHAARPANREIMSPTRRGTNAPSDRQSAQQGKGPGEHGRTGAGQPGRLG